MHQNSAEASENMHADYNVGNAFTIHGRSRVTKYSTSGGAGPSKLVKQQQELLPLLPIEK